MIDDLPAMIETGYEAVPEEDFVRMQWYGLYHDKPKLGYFMLRVKIPGGVLTPAQLRHDRRGLAAVRPRLRRADHAAERPAPLDRARRGCPRFCGILEAAA